jgi:hypothetical protein
VEVSYFDGQGNFERTSSARTVQITDNDGIPNNLEATTPSQPGQTLLGDGNRDGVLDTLQVQVTASQVAGLTGYASSFITFVADSNKGAIDADPGTAVLRNFKIDVLSPTVKPNPSMSFKADVGSGGATETFSVFADVAFAFSGFWLQNKSGVWTNIATGSEQVGTQLRVDFSLTDGGAFDADGLANGVIEVAGGRGQLALSLVGQNPAPPPGSDFIV